MVFKYLFRNISSPEKALEATKDFTELTMKYDIEQFDCIKNDPKKEKVVSFSTNKPIEDTGFFQLKKKYDIEKL